MVAKGFPGEANLIFVLRGDFFNRRRTYLMPFMMRVYFVAYHPAPDASVCGISRRPSSGDEVGKCLIAGASFGGHRVGAHRCAFDWIGLRVDG